MYAQFLIHISMAKSAYNPLYSITIQSLYRPPYSHVTFIASRPCKNRVSLDIPPNSINVFNSIYTKNVDYCISFCSLVYDQICHCINLL